MSAKVSGFKITVLSPPDPDNVFSKAMARAREHHRKTARYMTWLYMRMVGKW